MTALDSPRAVESPQGKVPENFLPHEPQRHGKLSKMKEKGVHMKRVKVVGCIVSQPICQKTDLMSVKQAIKLANKIGSPMFLCLLQPKELPKEKKRKPRPKPV